MKFSWTKKYKLTRSATFRTCFTSISLPSYYNTFNPSTNQQMTFSQNKIWINDPNEYHTDITIRTQQVSIQKYNSQYINSLPKTLRPTSWTTFQKHSLRNDEIR